MENKMEFGSAGMETYEGTDTTYNEKLMKEYQAQLNEAVQLGNPERESFYRAKIDTLNRTVSEKSDKENLGSEPFPEIRQHRDAAMNYERRANELERKIQRGRESKDKMSEVQQLRNRAAAEKREMERAKQNYRSQPGFHGNEELRAHQGVASNEKMGAHQGSESNEALGAHQGSESDEVLGAHQGTESDVELRAHQGKADHEISFGGGLGVDEMQHIRGSQKISEARSKRMQAETYMSSARKARMEGNESKASSLESQARSLRSSANSLEKEGKDLVSKAEA